MIVVVVVVVVVECCCFLINIIVGTPRPRSPQFSSLFIFQALFFEVIRSGRNPCLLLSLRVFFAVPVFFRFCFCQPRTYLAPWIFLAFILDAGAPLEREANSFCFSLHRGRPVGKPKLEREVNSFCFCLQRASPIGQNQLKSIDINSQTQR